MGVHPGARLQLEHLLGVMEDPDPRERGVEMAHERLGAWLQRVAQRVALDEGRHHVGIELRQAGALRVRLERPRERDGLRELRRHGPDRREPCRFKLTAAGHHDEGTERLARGDKRCDDQRGHARLRHQISHVLVGLIGSVSHRPSWSTLRRSRPACPKSGQLLRHPPVRRVPGAVALLPARAGRSRGRDAAGVEGVGST
jgi:hypothetical protein